MALETVVVRVYDAAPIPQPVDGVIVRFFDSTGSTFITEATTGSVTTGEAEVTLNGEVVPVEYQLRFYVTGGSITSPQQIEVFSPPAGSPTGTNRFEATAIMRTLPSATDPFLCRASGYVRGPDGRPIRGIDMHFIPCFNPVVVGGDGVLGERVVTRTDKDGYVTIDLYRNGEYAVTVESHENIQRIVPVPDRPSANINYLLFPIVVGVTWSLPGPLAMTAGSDVLISAAVHASNYRDLSGIALEDMIYSTGDPSIAIVTPSAVEPGKLVIRAVAPGTTTLEAKRKDLSVVYFPVVDVANGTIDITVS